METNIPIEEQLSALETQKPIMEKLQKIQGELFVPKGQRNDFGKYDYRSCEDILKAVKPICEKYKCVLSLGNAVPVFMEGRFYIKTTVQLYDLETCAAVKSTAYAREETEKKGADGSQITGASISYARKYALAGLFCIDNEKDSDATNTGDSEQKEKPAAKKKETKPELISAAEKNAIKAELTRTGVNESVVLYSVKKSKLDDLTHADYLTVIKRLNATSDKES